MRKPYTREASRWFKIPESTIRGWSFRLKKKGVDGVPLGSKDGY